MYFVKKEEKIALVICFQQAGLAWCSVSYFCRLTKPFESFEFTSLVGTKLL